MREAFSFVLALAMVALAGSSACCAKTSATTLSSLTFDATSYWAGTCKVTATNKALRIDWPDGMFLVSKAPKWNVTIYSDKTKKGMKFDYAEYLNHRPYWQSSFEEHDWPRKSIVMKVGTTVFEHAQYDKYALALRDDKGKLSLRAMGTPLNYLVLPTQDLPLQVFEILQKTFDLPTASGIPVFLQTTRPEKDHVHGLDLSLGGKGLHYRARNMRKIDTSPTIFAVPNVRSVVAREYDVHADSKSKADVEYFLSDPNEATKRH